MKSTILRLLERLHAGANDMQERVAASTPDELDHLFVAQATVAVSEALASMQAALSDMDLNKRREVAE